MPRELLRFALLVLVTASAGCSVLVDSTLSGKTVDGGGTDEGVDSGPPDLGVDMSAACPAPCGLHAGCNASTHVCECDSGWMMSGSDCVDVNECATAGACDANALCENLPGSVRCTCLPGLTGDGHTCTGPQILGLGGDDALPTIQTAVARVGGTATMTNDTAMFTTMLGDGTAWSAVVITSISSPTLDPAAIAAIQAYVSGGGRVVCATWQIGVLTDLQTALGVGATSFMGANSVVTDTMTTPDLFAQRGTFPSPLALHTSAFFTEGARLTGGISVATLGTGGGSAIVLTTGGHVVVNGFTLSEALASATPDADSDGIPDVEELLSNELDYLLRPHVLLYYDGSEPTPGSTTAMSRVGMTAFAVRSSTDFDRVYDRGDFAIIFVDSSSNYIDASNQTRVAAWTATVGKTLFSYWELAGTMMDTTVLRSALGVTADNPFNMPRRVFGDPTAPIDFFTYHDTFPIPLVGTDSVFVDGDEIAPVDATTAFVAGRYDSATGPGAIVVARGGKSIVNGFVGVEYGMDGDSDGVSDMAEMYSNELLYLVSRP